MKPHSNLAVGLLATTCAAGAMAQDASVGDRVAQIDAYVSRMHDFGAFSGVLLIAQGEDILLAKGWGEADKESGRAWTPDTVSTVGSITKQFTGAAAMALVQDGKLSPEDTIGTYFPDAPADKASITVHQLLTHSAGMPGAIGRDAEQLDRETYLARVWETPLLFSPGERYEYSNVGYSVAAAIIEVVSGQDYESFVQERLFAPAGMTQTGYVQVDWNPEQIATGYDDGEHWGTVIEVQGDDGFSWHLIGNGGIHSTARDMHKWWLAIRNNTVLDEKHTEMYLAPHQDEGGGDAFYGYGWVNFEGPDGQRMLTHNGGNGIFVADCAFFPEEDLFIYGMVNDSPATGVNSQDVFAALMGESLYMPPDASMVDIDEVNALACRRALAWVEALNSGPDAYVAYGAEHRIDEGKDAELNESRRESAGRLAERWGALAAQGCEVEVPGTARVNALAENGGLVRVRVTLAPESPHRVVSITLSMSGGGGGGMASAEEVIQRAREMAEAGMAGDAIAMLAELTEREPEHGEAWFQLGYVRLISGENDASMEPFENAIAQGFSVPNAHYNLACAHAKEGRTERALDALEQAVNAGWDDVRAMQHDPDLASLRGEARFREIVKNAGGV